MPSFMVRAAMGDSDMADVEYRYEAMADVEYRYTAAFPHAPLPMTRAEK
jgi:hypothetical protein